MPKTEKEYQDLLSQYKKLNIATGIISAGGETLAALMNYNNMNKNRFYFSPVPEVAADNVTIQSPDVFNPAVDEMERAYARGVTAAREAGSDVYANLLSKYIEGVGKASSMQAQTDLQAINQETSANLQSRMQARQINAQIDQFNTQMQLKSEGMKFESDSLFSTNIMKGLANMTNIISSIPLNNMRAEMQMDEMFFNRELVEQQMNQKTATDPLQEAIANYIMNQSGGNNSENNNDNSKSKGDKAGETVSLNPTSTPETFTDYASLSPAAKKFVQSIGGWKPYELGKKGENAYDCSGAACEYLGIEDIVNTDAANIFDNYTNKGQDNLLKEDELQDGDMVYLDKEGATDQIGVVVVDKNGNRWIAEQRSEAGSSFMDFNTRIGDLKQAGYNIRYFRPKTD